MLQQRPAKPMQQGPQSHQPLSNMFVSCIAVCCRALLLAHGDWSQCVASLVLLQVVLLLVLEIFPSSLNCVQA